MMKAIVRVSIAALVLAGATATSFTPKTQAANAAIATPNGMGALRVDTGAKLPARFILAVGKDTLFPTHAGRQGSSPPKS